MTKPNQETTQVTTSAQWDAAAPFAIHAITDTDATPGDAGITSDALDARYSVKVQSVAPSPIVPDGLWVDDTDFSTYVAYDDGGSVGFVQIASPFGSTGPAGPEGPAGPGGSPDTAAQVLAKLVTVDGSGSGLDADLLDGINATALVQTTGAQTIDGVKTFSASPIVPSPMTDTQAANRAFVLANAGGGSGSPGVVQAGAGVGVEATDEATLTTALAACGANGVLHLYPGSTYVVGDYTWTNPPNGLKIKGNGATIKVSTTATGHGWKIMGAKGTIGTVNSGATVGSTSLVMSSTAHGFAPGDWLVVGSADGHMDELTTFTRGEYVQVATGSAASATITLVRGLRALYTTSVRAAKYTFVNGLQISDLNVEHNAASTNRAQGMFLQYLYNCRLDNINVQGNDVARNGFQVEECLIGSLANSYAANVTDSKSPSNAVIEGYSWYFVGCEGWDIDNTNGYRNKHHLDFNAYGGSGNPRPVCRHMNISNCYSYEAYSSGFSSHTGSEYINWTNCHSIFCGGGFIIRGNDSSLTDCKMVGHWYRNAPFGEPFSYDHQIWIGQGAGGGRAGDGTRITGFRGDTSAKTSGRGIYGIRCDDVARNVQVSDSSFVGFTEAGIAWRGNKNEDITIDNVVMDCDDAFDGHGAIVISPGQVEARSTQTRGSVTAGNYFDRVTISNVTVKNCRGNPITVIGGDTTRRSTMLTVDNFASLSPDASATASTAIIGFDNGFVDGFSFNNVRAPDSTGSLVEFSDCTVVPLHQFEQDPMLDWFGYLGWAWDPNQATSTLATTSGTIHSTIVHVGPGRVTDLAYQVVTAGVTLTASRNFLVAYRPGVGGALLAQSVDQTTAMGSTGYKEASVTAFDWPGGYMRIGVKSEGATPVSVARGGSSVVGNMGAAVPRYATSDGGTTTTAPAAIGALSGSGNMMWVAVKGTAH